MKSIFITLLVAAAWGIAIFYSLADPDFNSADVIMIILTLVFVTWIISPERN